MARRRPSYGKSLALRHSADSSLVVGLVQENQVKPQSVKFEGQDSPHRAPTAALAKELGAVIERHMSEPENVVIGALANVMVSYCLLSGVAKAPVVDGFSQTWDMIQAQEAAKVS